MLTETIRISFISRITIYVHYTHILQNVHKWVPLCCTVVVEHIFIVVDVLYLNSMINHCRYMNNDCDWTRCVSLAYSYK